MRCEVVEASDRFVLNGHRLGHRPSRTRQSRIGKSKLGGTRQTERLPGCLSIREQPDGLIGWTAYDSRLRIDGSTRDRQRLGIETETSILVRRIPGFLGIVSQVGFSRIMHVLHLAIIAGRTSEVSSVRKPSENGRCGLQPGSITYLFLAC